MCMSSSKKLPEPQYIPFDNGNTARAILPPQEMEPTDATAPASPAKGATPQEILAALEIASPEAVLIVSGGAAPVDQLDPRLKSRLAELFIRGVAPAAAEKKAVIIDGGTNAGVMALMGQAAAENDHQTPLIGVAPYQKVTFKGKTTADPDGAPLEPNHSHFVLTRGRAWGDETGMRFALAKELVKDAPAGTTETPQDKDSARKNTPPVSQQPITPRRFRLPRWIPRPKKAASAADAAGAAKTRATKAETKITPGKKQIVVVLAGGEMDGSARREVLHAGLHGWSVVVVKDTGGLADEIARLKHEQDGIARRRARSGENRLRRLWYLMNLQELSTNDAGLRQFVAGGKLSVLDSNGSSEQLRQLLAQKLTRASARNDVLQFAWQRFAVYDQNAGRQQQAFERSQQWLIGLGVLVTLLAILTSLVGNIPNGNVLASSVSTVLRAATVIVTVLITGFTAYRNRFAAGPKWILLRANAESIKREIYPYRAQADVYGEAALGKKPNTGREAELAERVAAVARRTMRTEVSASALEPYDGSLPPTMYGAAGKDDGFSELEPEGYIKIRIDDQLSYYRKSTVKKERQLKRYQSLMFIAAGTATLLAFAGQEPWIPLTTAIAAAFASMIEYRQLESTLIKYNQAEADLANLKGWWNGLSKAQRDAPDNKDSLVRLTEEIIDTEIAGWSRRMQNALEDLRKETESKPGDASQGTAGETSTQAAPPAGAAQQPAAAAQQPASAAQQPAAPTAT